MRDSTVNTMVTGGLADRTAFNDQLSNLFLAFKEGKDVNPIILLEAINAQLSQNPGIDGVQDLTLTLATRSLDDPTSVFEIAKNKLGKKPTKNTRLELEHMKFEVLAAMLNYVVTNPISEKSQKLVEALYTHGSKQDRAVLTSIGKRPGIWFASTWESFADVLGRSSAPTATQIVLEKQNKQKEMSMRLAGTPKESHSVRVALEPLINRHGYSLSLNSAGENPEKGIIYLEKASATSVKYTVVDPQGNLQEGVVTMKQLIGDGTTSEKISRERRINEILRGQLDQKTCEEELLPAVLNVAINAGHAHINLSFIDTIKNENIQGLIREAEKITTDDLEKINTPESQKTISHKDLPQIAAELETIEVFILSLQRALELSGNDLSSDQKAVIYRQLDNLKAAVLNAQEKTVASMVQRLGLLDSEVLKELDPLDSDREYYCDERTKTLLKAHKITDISDQLKRLQHISTTDIIKYLVYIAKAGAPEERIAIYKKLADKVGISHDALNQWLDNKLKDWGVKLTHDEKQTLLEFIESHKELFQSPKDKEKNEMTITEDDFFKLCSMMGTIQSFNNKAAMQKVIKEAENNDAFKTRENFSEFCAIFTPTTVMGASIFKLLYPYLGEDGSVFGICQMIKKIENDRDRVNLFTKIAEKFGGKTFADEFETLIAITDREKGSNYATMPTSFFERCLNESDSLESYLQNLEQVNESVKNTSFFSILGKALSPEEIAQLVGIKPNEGDSLVKLAQDVVNHLGENNLILAGKFLKEMQKNQMTGSGDKDELRKAGESVLAIIAAANTIMKNLPQYPQNEDDLRNNFADLLVELRFFKQDYGNNPLARSVLHHALKQCCSDRNLEHLLENTEAYQRPELQILISAVRRFENYPHEEVTPTNENEINIEIEDKYFDTDEENINLVNSSFDSAASYLKAQKEAEMDAKLKMAINKLADVATHPGHRPIETLKASQDIIKLSTGTKRQISNKNFIIAILSFCEVFHKYPPRQRLIEKLRDEILELTTEKKSEHVLQDTSSHSNRPAPPDSLPTPGKEISSSDGPITPKKDRPTPPDTVPPVPDSENIAPKKQ